MRSVCTATDAKQVIEIMKSSMVDYYENELAMMDLSTTLNGTASSGGGRTSKSASIKQFVAVLQRVADDKKDKQFTTDEIKSLYEVRSD